MFLNAILCNANDHFSVSACLLWLAGVQAAAAHYVAVCTKQCSGVVDWFRALGQLWTVLYAL